MEKTRLYDDDDDDDESKMIHFQIEIRKKQWKCWNEYNI